MRFHKPLRYTGLVLVLAVLAVGPFLRGLFFWTELLGAIAAVSAGFGLWLLGRRLGGLGGGIPGGVAGAALMALLGLYLLQFAWAVFPRGNLDWVLRVAASWFAYVMVRAEAGPALRRWLGWTFVVSAAGVGVLGFLEYTGYALNDPSLATMLKLVGLSDRMFTTFQYPNTAAIFFLAAVLTAAGLALEGDFAAWRMGLAGSLMTFLLLAFFFTVSRGAVVALPFGLLLWFAGLENRRRWAGLLLLLAAVAPMVVAMGKVGLFSAAHNYISAFKWIAAATVGGGVAGVALAFFLRLKLRWQGVVAGAVLVAAVLALLVVRPAGGLLPKQATRLLDMNFKTVNVVLRLLYTEDALKMAADRPLGRGGWGWDRGYRQIQEFNYIARETHDHYAQTAAEAGWAGLAALVTAVLAGLWAAWQNRGENPLGWSLAAGAGLIAAHSAIDFNLSFGVVWLLLWSLLAVAARPDDRVWRFSLAGGGVAAVAAVAAVAVCVAALVLGQGSRLVDRAAALAEKGSTEQAVTVARQAVSFDPWNSEPYMIVGDLVSLERAVAVDPWHSGAQFKLAVARDLAKDLPGALAAARAALRNQPMVSMHFAKVATLEGNLLNDALHDGRKADATAHATALVELGRDFERRKAVGDPLQRLWAGAPKLTMSADFKLRYGQALFLTGDRAAAEPLLKEAAKVGLLGSEAELWLYVLAEKQGDKKAMAALESKPWIRFRAANPIYKLIREW